jgi:protein-S-isoprenylcysteine O-methyltransferase Ste14
MPGPKAGATLVTRGIYARIRHPLYASVMAMAVSWALAWGSLTGLGAAVLLAGFLHLKTFHEEGLLKATFPDYASYARSVPRYIPGVQRAGA